jgi:hypothetical protein
MPVKLDDIVTGLGMLGGLLATPRRIEAQQQQSDIERQLLQGSGMSQTDIDAATPQPSMRWLSPQQGGFTGKILGGVGDVGSLLSSVVGKPIAAPRASLSDLAEASKMRIAHQKDLAEADLIDKMQHGGKPEEIAALGIKSGHGDAAFRYLGRSTGPQHPPGSPFAARVRLHTLDPNSDEARQLQAGLDADQAARTTAADEAQKRAEQRFRDTHPFADISPEQEQHRKFVQLQTDRGAYADSQHYTPEQKAFFIGHGFPMPTAKPARGLTMKDVAGKVAGEMHSEQPSIEPDPDTLRRRIYARAKTLSAQGIKIDDFDPSITPPPEPPPPEKPAAPPPQTWRQWAGFGGPDETSTTNTPTTTSSSTTQPSHDPLPPEWSFLDEIPISTPEQVAQGQQLHDALLKGMPLDAAKNWAIAIGQMPAKQALPQQQAYPR